MNKWNIRFIELADFISQWSKDPSTKIGCVIADENNRIVSTGYNGFPKGVDDSEERYNNRDIKYPIIVHAEVNAITFAKRDLTGCKIYISGGLPPCVRCSSLIIQSGIKEVYYKDINSEAMERWKEDIKLGAQILKEAGVKVIPLSFDKTEIHYPCEVRYLIEQRNNVVSRFRLYKPLSNHIREDRVTNEECPIWCVYERELLNHFNEVYESAFKEKSQVRVKISQLIANRDKFDNTLFKNFVIMYDKNGNKLQEYTEEQVLNGF
jgi:dCMP deaminase